MYLFSPRILPATFIAGIILSLFASEADAARCKVYRTRSQFKAVTNVTVTSGTPGCITVDTPQPIAVGNSDGKVRYKLCCVDGAAPCSSIITVSGTGTDGNPLSYMWTASCRNGALCSLPQQDPIGFDCELDECLCGQVQSETCIYDDADSECASGTCHDVVECPTVSTWGLIAMTLVVLTAGTVLLLRRRAAMASG